MAVLTERDASILQQVAWKGAIELQGAPIATDEGKAEFESNVAYLSESLFESVKASMDSVSGSVASYTPTPTPAAVNVDPAAVLNRELGATPVIEVVNKDGQQGPFPEWFLAAAAKDGVTRVFDNRGDLGPKGNRPWFKQALTRDEEAAGVEAKVYWAPRD